VVRRPGFVESAEKPRALLAAFAEVPGPTAAGVRAEQLLLGFSEDVELDALTLKGAALTHIQRVGAARMMRVPVPDVDRDAAAAFHDRLATFRRALTRQLESDRYDVVLCLDLFAAATAAPLLKDARLVIDVADVPSSSFVARWPVEADDDGARQAWSAAEKTALRAARLLMVPSRMAGRALSERADPRRLRAAPRLVDTRQFVPPSMELALDDQRTVVVLGGREERRAVATADLLQRLARRLPDARLLLVGHPARASAVIADTLARRNLRERVVVVDVTTPAERAQALQAADVVVVPAGRAGDGWGLPHRVLEAMACERAVIVGGTEAAYKDAVAHGVHVRVVDGDADDLARAARDLLADDDARRALARAARKQALGFDLVGRLPEVAQLLQEATDVRFIARVPPLDDGGAPDAMPSGATPRRPLASVVAVPAAAVAAEYSEGAAAPPPERPGGRRSTPPLPAPSTAEAPAKGPGSSPAPVLPRALAPVPAPVALRPPALVPTPTPEKGATAAPAAAPAAVLSATDGAPGPPAPVDAWSGETVLDDGSGARIAVADVGRIKAALLHTTSGDTVRPEAGAATVEAPPSGARPARPQMPRSMSLVSDVLDGEDDWSRDTLADASPVDASAPAPTHELASGLPAPRPVILDGVGEPTAEDGEHDR